jgi:hypothetical protein
MCQAGLELTDSHRSHHHHLHTGSKPSEERRDPGWGLPVSIDQTTAKQEEQASRQAGKKGDGVAPTALLGPRHGPALRCRGPPSRYGCARLLRVCVCVYVCMEVGKVGSGAGRAGVSVHGCIQQQFDRSIDQLN